MKSEKNISPKSKKLFVGIDWADKEHAICLITPDGNKKHLVLKQDPDVIIEWVTQTQQQFSDCEIVIAIEQSKGALMHILMAFDAIKIYPINPKQSANYRSALSPSGKKDDPGDAELLALFLQHHQSQLRVWSPNSVETRQLAQLGELRRKLVDDRKKQAQKLRSCLKLYFPWALNYFDSKLTSPLFLALLKRWPTLQQLKRAKPQTLRTFLSQHGKRNEEKQTELINSVRSATPLTRDKAILLPNSSYAVALVQQLLALNKAIEEFDKELAKVTAQHPDEKIFRALPGAGDALVPRMISAFGSDRTRFQSAAEVQSYTGIAPVTRSSGNYHSVKKRYACPKFLRQTFHEFADHARKWSSWSGAYYAMQRAKGTKHHAALRALAFKWIRIIFHLWKHRKEYNEEQYIAQLRCKNSPIIKFLKTA